MLRALAKLNCQKPELSLLAGSGRLETSVALGKGRTAWGSE